MGMLRVMIADDQEEMLRVLVRKLSINHEVVAAVQNGRFLVESALSLKPDVIVSDVSMPDKTGPQALEELTALGCRIPFVFITAETELITCDGWSVVDKADIFAELEPAIESVVQGKVYVSHRVRILRNGNPFKP